MLAVEGTVTGLRESEPRFGSDGSQFTNWTLSVFGGGTAPYYLDLPKDFPRETLPAVGTVVKAAVYVRAYPSSKTRSGASYGLTLLAIMDRSDVAP